MFQRIGLAHLQHLKFGPIEPHRTIEERQVAVVVG
jgi:hypothetical protein